MEITGRLTTDAQVRRTKNNKEVVSFTVAVGDRYRTKEGEVKEETDYFNCSYWQSGKVAEHLHKGGIVTVSGRVHLNEYQGKDGNKYAEIACTVRNLKIQSFPKKENAGPKVGTITATAERSAAQTPTTGTTTPTTPDDLPF